MRRTSRQKNAMISVAVFLFLVYVLLFIGEGVISVFDYTFATSVEEQPAGNNHIIIAGTDVNHIKE